MDFEKMIKDKLGEAVIEKIGQQFGVGGSEAEGVIDKALPAILGGLGKNVEDEAKAKELEEAIKKDHDGSVLDKLKDAVGDESIRQDGSKILGHIFGDKKGSVEQEIGNQTGQETGVVDGIMSVLGPVVLGQLGKKQKEDGLSLGDLTGILGGEKKKAEGSLGGIMGMLDRDNDGSVVDDLMDMGKGLLK